MKQKIEDKYLTRSTEDDQTLDETTRKVHSALSSITEKGDHGRVIHRAAQHLEARPSPPYESSAIQGQISDFFPLPSTTLPACPHTTSHSSITVKAVQQAIQNADFSTGAALSGWTDKLVHQLSGDRFCLQGITDLVWLIANSKLSRFARAYLTMEKLGLLYKKDVGNEVRDIHVHEPFLKIAGHVVRMLMPPTLFRDIFPSVQLGFKTSGVEEAIHTHNAILSVPHPKGIAMGSLLLDGEKAFSSLDRAVALNDIYGNECLRPLWRLVNFEYGGPVICAAVRNRRLVASEVNGNGSGAGGVWSSLVYALPAQKRVYEKVEKYVKDKCIEFGYELSAVTAIIDDLTISAPVEVLMKVIAFDSPIHSWFAELGVKLNMRKSKILIVQQKKSSTARRVVQLLKDNQVQIELLYEAAPLLGSLIGNIQRRHAHKFWEAKIETPTNRLSACLLHPDMNHAFGFALLRKSILAKPIHILRTLDPSLIRYNVAGFVAHKEVIAEHLLGCSVSQNQLKLPVQDGFGFTNLEAVSPAAFLASILTVRHFVRSQLLRSANTVKLFVASPFCKSVLYAISAMDHLPTLSGLAQLSPTEKLRVFFNRKDKAIGFQAKLMGEFQLKHLSAFEATLKNTADPQLLALRAATSAPSASAPLTMLEFRGELALNNSQFHLYCAMRAGQNPFGLPESVYPTTCPLCNFVEKGSLPYTHFLRCTSSKMSRLRTQRHHLLKRQVQRCIQSTVGGRIENEPTDLLPPVKGEGRTPDWVIYGASNACRKAVYDITIVDPTAPTHVDVVMREGRALPMHERFQPLAVTALVEKRKNKHYKASCKAVNAEFFPLVLEAYGGISKITLRCCRSWGSMHSDMGFPDLRIELIRVIQFTMVRENFRMMQEWIAHVQRVLRK
jgi:hypothetical protein